MGDIDSAGSGIRPDDAQAPSPNRWPAWLPVERAVMIGAVLLWALLCESAVENVWRGSPIRWWVLGASVVSALLVGLAWRRMGWRSRLAAAAALLMGELNLAVLRVGTGITPGFYVAGLTLARLVWLLVTCAIVMAVFAVSRAPLLARRRAWAIGLGIVGVYALLPFVVAVARDLSFDVMLSGRGVGTSWMPFWLQPSYLAAEVLIPFGLAACVVWLGWSRWKRPADSRVVVAVAGVMLLASFLVLSVELSRAGVSHMARAVVDPLLSRLSISGAPASPSSAGPRSGGAAPAQDNKPPSALVPDDDWLKPYRAMTLDQAFVEVATRMRYEPYAGVLRGARGTAVAAGGNSMDKSLLLAAILREGGYEVRFVRGPLTPSNLAAVLRGLYPPKVPSVQLAADFAPFDPAQDPTLQAIAREHTWVELNQGDTWLPLDPSFPRAKIGEAYAEAIQRFTEPPEADFQQLEMRIKVQTGGRTADLGGFKGKAADLALQPIALVVDATPVRESANAAPAKPTAGGLFGDAMSGGQAKPEPPKKTGVRPLIGVRFTRQLMVGESARPVGPTVSLAGNAATRLEREWLEFTLTGPGGLRRRFDRVVQEGTATGVPLDLTARHRRIGITVLSGPVSVDSVSRQTARIGPALDLGAARRDIGGLDADGDNAKATASIAVARRVEASVGGTAAFLLPLVFAAQSDALTDQIAYSNHVAVVRGTPRVLLATFETIGNEKGTAKSETSLDLRFDEVQAYAYPQYPELAARIFQTGRGFQESVLEGLVVQQRTGQTDVVTTASLMREASATRIELLAVTPSTASELDRARGMPAGARRFVEAALKDGRNVVMPISAVRLAGRDRWGWWTFDPGSGAVTGVMESGQHQATVEYAVNLDEIGLNEDTGFALGCIVGGTTTQIFLVAKLLEYGEVTPELIEDVKKYVEGGSCNSACPPKIEGGAFNEANVAGDCFKKALGKEIGGRIVVKFCDRYNDGFKCAGGFILAGLKGESPGAGAKSEIGVAYPNCAEDKSKVGGGNQAK
ncbi:MAG: hypothetical protein WCP29_12665 [Acidobacteriota bacterium]